MTEAKREVWVTEQDGKPVGAALHRDNIHESHRHEYVRYVPAEPEQAGKAEALEGQLEGVRRIARRGMSAARHELPAIFRQIVTLLAAGIDARPVCNMCRARWVPDESEDTTVRACPSCRSSVAEKAGKAQAGWVPVGERLPGHHQRVIVCDARANWWAVCTWDNERERWVDIETDAQNDWHTWAPCEVTHWREPPELPAPPSPPTSKEGA